MYYTFGYAVWQVEEASHPLASDQVGRAYFPPDVLPVSPRGAQLPAYVSQLPVVPRAPAAELPGFWVVVFLLQVAGLLKNVTLNTNDCLSNSKIIESYTPKSLISLFRNCSIFTPLR